MQPLARQLSQGGGRLGGPTAGGQGSRCSGIYNARAVQVSAAVSATAGAGAGAAAAAAAEGEEERKEEAEEAAGKEEKTKQFSSSEEAADAAVEVKLQLHLPCTVTFSVGGAASQLQVGDLVRLASQAADATQLRDSRFSVEGIVVQLDRGSSMEGVVVELPWQPVGLTDQLWQLHCLGNLTTYKRCLEGLAALAAGGSTYAAAVGAASAAPDRALQHIITASWQWQQDRGCMSVGEADADALVQQLKASGEQAVGQDVVQCGVSDAQLQAVSGGALNAAQEAAVKAAAEQRLTLIWGPPGTGKVGRGSLTAVSGDAEACSGVSILTGVCTGACSLHRELACLGHQHTSGTAAKSAYQTCAL